jgi:hypothetical protein
VDLILVTPDCGQFVIKSLARVASTGVPRSAAKLLTKQIRRSVDQGG